MVLLYHKRGKIKSMTTIILVIALIPIIIIVGIGVLAYVLIKKINTTSMESKTKAVDVFVYLGIFITLIASVANIIQVLFKAIEMRFTDVLEAGQYVDIYGGDMRMAIASLIVLFPIYLALSWYSSQDIKKFLFKRDLIVRKSFIYITLFVTACTLIGALVATIYTYLGGELTLRFELKALTVFAIAGAVCAYYVYSLRRDYTKKTYVPGVITVLAVVVVLGSLIWSVSIIGSPAEMRLKRIDDTRLNDISRIQQEVFNHFQTTEKLPVNLDELNDAFQGYVVPVDPVTKEAYTYKVVQQPVLKMNYTTNRKELSTLGIFELCATFDTVREYDSRGTPVIGKGGSMDSFYSVSNYYYSGDMTPFWNHGIGETCFKRIISSDMYYGR